MAKPRTPSCNECGAPLPPEVSGYGRCGRCRDLESRRSELWRRETEIERELESLKLERWAVWVVVIGLLVLALEGMTWGFEKLLGEESPAVAARPELDIQIAYLTIIGTLAIAFLAAAYRVFVIGPRKAPRRAALRRELESCRRAQSQLYADAAD